MNKQQPLLLRFLQGQMTNRQFTLLPGEAYIVGSHSESDIRVDGDPTVSRRHACLKLGDNGILEVMDLGSTNGTWVNNKKIKKIARIKIDDVLQFGLNTVCNLQPWQALESSLPPHMRAGFDLISRDTLSSTQAFSITAPLWFTVAGFCIGGICFGLWQAYDVPGSGFARTTPYLDRSVSKTITIDRSLSAKDFTAQPPEGKDKTSQDTDVPLIANNFVWDEIINISQRFGEVPPSAMDSRFVKEVEHWIAFYTKNNRHQELLRRRDHVWDRIQKILHAHGLPSELGYIAWVESAFDPQATSHAGAVGVWQFISSTANDYGLRPLTGDSRDQRRNLEHSTHAAARYLNSLLQMFGNRQYLLALAAYNAGQNKIKRHEIKESIKNARKADFWHVREHLPKETQDYVPKVMAAIIIGRNPDFW